MKGRYILFVAIIMFLCFIPSNIVKGNELVENQNKLKYVEGLIKETEMAIEKINNQANELSHEIRNVDGLIAETEQEIAVLEQSIAQKEKEIELIQKNKSVLANNIEEAKTKFEEVTKDLRGEGQDFIDYAISADNPRDLNQRLNSLKMAYEIYQKAIEKYEADLVNEQAKEGTVLIEMQNLERDKQIVLQKKEFVQDQLNKKHQLFNNLMAEKSEKEHNQSELEQASKELENVIEEIQRRAKESNGYTIIRSGGKLHWPSGVSERVTSKYGKRTHPITGEKGKMHNGLDIGAPSGSPVLAAENGVVIHSGWIRGYGYTVIIDHGDDLSTLYAHNSKLLVKSGEKVSRGQEIAKVGSTGNSTGPHIHFEVRISGTPVNPMPYLQ